jgi:putative hydrolase of the HAD superfamily
VRPVPDAVLFDAGGTLVHVTPSVGAVYAEQAKPFGVIVDPAEVDVAFFEVFPIRRGHSDGLSPFHTSEEHEHAWWRELVEAVFARVNRLRDFDGRFNEYFDVLFEHFAHPDPWSVYDDVIPTLDTLKTQGTRLAIASNWDSRLPRVLQGVGLADYFELVLTSAEVGYSKPHRTFYESALDRLGLPADRMVYVGDSVENDIEGAATVAMTAYLIDRKGKHSDQPHALHRLTDLLPIFE